MKVEMLPTFTVSNVVQTVGFVLKKLFSTIYCRLYRTFHTLLFIQVLYSMYYSFVSVIIGRKKVEWKTHWQSPVCHDILRRKHFMARSKASFLWGLLYLLISAVLILDMTTRRISSLFLDYSNMIWYLELSGALFVIFNACIATWLSAWIMFTRPMPISPIQLKLFGIDKSDPGFQVKDKLDSPHSLNENKFLYTSCHLSDQSSGLSITPLNYSTNSWATSQSGCLDSTSSSWSFHRRTPNIYMSTPKIKRTENFVVNKHIFHMSADESLIRNSKQLEEFLKQCEEEEKIKSMCYEDSIPNITSIDNSPLSILSKSRYQRACRLPSSDTVERDSSETHYGDVLHKLKITEKMFTLWCEKLRKWISQTILVKLVTEIEEVNCNLCQLSLPEYLIGTVNLFALHQIASSKFQHLRTLSTILPYLDMHLNQEYLVQRLKDLAKGGCLSEFKWNSGGFYGDKPWCDDLPTDSAIILHMLSCYFDSYLPPEPHFPGGKPFSSKYLKKIPEKLTPFKDTCFIYQSSAVPPHFKVVIGQDIYSLAKGRNNLFHAFLIVFHHLKTQKNSMLGRVNLGASGLNLLWIIE